MIFKTVFTEESFCWSGINHTHQWSESIVFACSSNWSFDSPFCGGWNHDFCWSLMWRNYW